MQHLELLEALTELSETTIRYVILLLVGVQDRGGVCSVAGSPAGYAGNNADELAGL